MALDVMSGAAADPGRWSLVKLSLHQTQCIRSSYKKVINFYPSMEKKLHYNVLGEITITFSNILVR